MLQEEKAHKPVWRIRHRNSKIFRCLSIKRRAIKRNSRRRTSEHIPWRVTQLWWRGSWAVVLLSTWCSIPYHSRIFSGGKARTTTAMINTGWPLESKEDLQAQKWTKLRSTQPKNRRKRRYRSEQEISAALETPIWTRIIAHFERKESRDLGNPIPLCPELVLDTELILSIKIALDKHQKIDFRIL